MNQNMCAITRIVIILVLKYCAALSIFVGLIEREIIYLLFIHVYVRREGTKSFYQCDVT